MKTRILAGLATCLALSPLSPQAASVGIEQLFTAGIVRPSEQAISRVETYQQPLASIALDSQKAWDRALLDGNDEAVDEEFYRLISIQGMDSSAKQLLSWGVTRHLAGYVGASERYGRDLNLIGALTKQPDIEEASIGVWFYLYAVTLADSHKCVDPSAARQFMVEVIEAHKSVHFDAAESKPADLARMANEAAALEALTAPDRVSDPIICLNGTSSTAMKPSADWLTKAEQTRLLLPDTLSSLAVRFHSHHPMRVQEWFDKDLAASRIDLHAELEKINGASPRLDAATLFNGATMALQLRDIEEAAFFFYAGQIRQRVDETIFPPRGGDAPQAIIALNQLIGQAINPAVFREPDSIERVYERLVDWKLVVESGYEPPWPTKRVLPADEINNVIKQQKQGFLKILSETVTLLQIPEYAEAVRHVQDYNLGSNAYREAPGAKEKFEAAEATIKRIKND